MFHLRSTCKEEINSLKVTASSYRDELLLLKSDLKEKNREIERLNSERAYYEKFKESFEKLLTERREQNEADIFFLADKIVRGVRSGKTQAGIGELKTALDYQLGQRDNLANLAKLQGSLANQRGDAYGSKVERQYLI